MNRDSGCFGSFREPRFVSRAADYYRLGQRAEQRLRAKRNATRAFVRAFGHWLDGEERLAHRMTLLALSYALALESVGQS